MQDAQGGAVPAVGCHGDAKPCHLPIPVPAMGQHDAQAADFPWGRFVPPIAHLWGTSHITGVNQAVSLHFPSFLLHAFLFPFIALPSPAAGPALLPSGGLHQSQEMLCWVACALPVQVFRCVFAPTVDTDAPVNLRHSHEQWELLAWLLCLLSILLTPDLLLRPSANGQGAITLQNPYRAAVFKSKIDKKDFHR